MYEFFEHTADLGLRIRAPDLPQLLAEGAVALFAAIVEDVQTVEPRKQLEVNIAGTDPDYLLFDWLRELLFRFEAEHWLFRRFEVTVTPDGLRGLAWGEPLDPARHDLAHEVKAITYHQLRVEQDAHGWLAEVIVDI